MIKNIDTMNEEIFLIDDVVTNAEVTHLGLILLIMVHG